MTYEKGHPQYFFHHTEEAKEKIRKAHLGMKFSEEHRKRLSESHMGNKGWWKGKKRPEMSGSRNPLWKGGIATENDKIRKSQEYIDWRLAVYRKDRWICHFCHKHCKRGDIIAHHVMLFSNFPKARFNLKNGMVLHRGCHLKLHNFFNRLEKKYA